MIPLLALLLLALAAVFQPRAACLPSPVLSSSPFNATAAPPSFPRGRVLALLPHPSQRFTRFSHLLSSIEARGWEVVARAADDPRLRLREWDNWLWDKIVVIPEDKDLGGAVDAGALLEFLSSGRDLLVALSPSSTPDLRALAEALGADTEPPGASVLSPGSCVEGDASNVVGDFGGVAPRAVVGRKSKKPSSPFLVSFPLTTAFTLPRAPLSPAPGIGAGVASAGATPRAFPLVAAVDGSAAFSTAKPASDDSPPAAGRSLALAVGVQALSGGRAVLAGSSDAFADDVIDFSAGDRAGKNNNAEFASSVSAWAFKDRGALLAASPLRHSLVKPLDPAHNGGSSDPWHRWGDAPYRIGDEIRVELDVLEADGRGGWVPFRVNDGDDDGASDENDGENENDGLDQIQVEYRMLDPYVRTAMRPLRRPNNNGTFSAVVRAPDVYGIFKFAVHFVRPGLTPLHVESVAPLRPFRHDEFDRFLAAAAPYYATIASVSVAFFAVVAVALYSE